MQWIETIGYKHCSQGGSAAAALSLQVSVNPQDRLRMFWEFGAQLQAKVQQMTNLPGCAMPANGPSSHPATLINLSGGGERNRTPEPNAGPATHQGLPDNQYEAIVKRAVFNISNNNVFL
ncbi:hypothetical protein NDU88_005048 [Pleurodeles waltl]|uniref:Uncharacterized protein n=1 Tax=Pleurodeles waltl TaxID=8319 RepID=A0AAV7PGX5_PLEWA|nr:hypothetical protein NDU88_005048 [Pleurodeles waltl]